MFIAHDTICQSCGKQFRVEYKNRKAKNCSRQCYRKKWELDHPTATKDSRRKCFLKNESAYREKEARRMYAQREQAKKKVFAVYGNACAVCGFSDTRALQLDHVNGGGRTYGLNGNNKARIAGARLYSKLLSGAFPWTDFQLLCANHNWIKRAENNEQNARKYV